MSVQLAKWTIEDYHQMIAAGVLDDRQVELLNGDIVEMVPEGIPHAAYSDRAARYLRRVLGERAFVREGKPITLPTTTSEPQPDLAIVQPDDLLYFQHHPYPENIFWLIEFSDSSLNKDTEIKRRIYAQAGILEYWVVNLKAMEVIVYRDPVEGEYRSITRHGAGELCPIALPQVRISVGDLLD